MAPVRKNTYTWLLHLLQSKFKQIRKLVCSEHHHGLALRLYTLSNCYFLKGDRKRNQHFIRGFLRDAAHRRSEVFAICVVNNLSCCNFVFYCFFWGGGCNLQQKCGETINSTPCIFPSFCQITTTHLNVFVLYVMDHDKVAHGK